MFCSSEHLISHIFFPIWNPSIHPCSSAGLLNIRCVRKSQRRGKLKYPSEKKKTRSIHKNNEKFFSKPTGFWRFSNVGVSVQDDPGNDSFAISEALLKKIAEFLKYPVASMLPADAFTVIRKSFDSRKILKEQKFVYTVDMDVERLLTMEPDTQNFVEKLKPMVSFLEHIPSKKYCGDLVKVIRDSQKPNENINSNHFSFSNTAFDKPNKEIPKVAIVGSGPSGLFASLVLAELGADVTLIERGFAVEQRGRDIGALVARHLLNPESNFCFGEGGAGTWSDGKLLTRIGKNSGSVLTVLKTLVKFGAPAMILVDGKPHLGTDKLVSLLRNFRKHLISLGVSIKFGTRVDDIIVVNRRTIGVKVSPSSSHLEYNVEKWGFDAVVLAVGHSARGIYEMLVSHNVELISKDFAIGLRIEHPQELINNIQYSKFAKDVDNICGKVPVADYKLAYFYGKESRKEPFKSKSESFSCYSFCMCPGGQVVLTTTCPSEICVNGMSFSKRSSKWANAALVVPVSSKDFNELGFHGHLAGVDFQREFEQKAAIMGGGNFVVPVQRVTDFLDNRLSDSTLPSSSYRLGVKAANLHDLLPLGITQALQKSILNFDNELKGFITKEALLHGVETRSSSPVQIVRNPDSFESVSLRGLYPVGEGAGYAGGIVSAAVDGMSAAFAIAKDMGLLLSKETESIFKDIQTCGGTEKR